MKDFSCDNERFFLHGLSREVANSYSFPCREKCVPLQGNIHTTAVVRNFLYIGTNKASPPGWLTVVAMP